MNKPAILSMVLTDGYNIFGEMAEGELFREFAENLAEKLSES